jgi:chitin disaccharide deacetylase
MIILTADDYAMTYGVSRAIEQLARAGRLSATSAMVTMPGWLEDAVRIRDLRGQVAIGLHLNLTLGAPAGPMPELAPRGTFPSLKALIARALSRRLSGEEIAGEIRRQLDLFERALGFPPDHIDGHQHVQVLPTIRRALLDEVHRRYRTLPPLLRDPSADGTGKARIVNALSIGFRRAAKRRGLPTNDGFAGFSAFDVARDYSDELHAAFAVVGQRAIVMCHPGFPDDTLASLDPVVDRRRQEYDALMVDATLPERIWRPQRASTGAPIDWPIQWPIA